ncbi:MAG: prepilin-type N-terminal cleavage/methylation domain-containing protein [Candidatus Marinimicrobia bacterium]|nr:prepilin-type N-terminal cleavage/methylation domain-containing protein [Candidatus Neomarinimicrobiota bacterium]
MGYNGSRGATLPELMVTLVIASIVAIGFSSVLMYSRNMYNDTQVRSQLSRDAFIVDRYVRQKLTLQIADSMRIYANAADESSGTTSSSGSILRAVRPDSTVDHLSVESAQLVWQIDTTTHQPIDSDISQLQFSQQPGFSKKQLTISMQLSEAGDTVELDWLVSIRN